MTTVCFFKAVRLTLQSATHQITGSEEPCFPDVTERPSRVTTQSERFKLPVVLGDVILSCQYQVG